MIDNLKRILKQEDTVLFIGSGVSLWSGLPSWTGLIDELIIFLKLNGIEYSLVEQELQRGDLLQAASFGFDKLTKQQIAEFIRRSCLLGTAKPQEIHNKIISLGPKCYITTNYDKLLELSFQKWLPDTHFRSVINRQLTETAEIVGARATNFLFKLHGDAEDSESIILTREQYRALNPGGEFHHALETTKTLMVSRPIVYIGFGLRDPDFLYLKDLLINTYKGGTRDHYAIIADVTDQEKDYWRRNFGIHIISYNCILKENNKRDHSPILDLLDKLISLPIENEKPAVSINAEFILNLARHASKYSNFAQSNSHIPLIVHPKKNNKRKRSHLLHQYYGSSVEKILDKGPVKMILIGPPGSGKSYALRNSAARLAKELNTLCIEDPFVSSKIIIPIFADLKLYQGSIIDLIEQNIPVGINFEFLLSNFKIKIFLDAFNEIPREYIESNHWYSDFSNLTERTQISLILSSRTSDGLENLDIPIFNLDSIDYEFVKNRLAQSKIELKGIYKKDILRISQRPFFYKLFFVDGFKIDSYTSPQKIYFGLISLINKKFQERFKSSLNMEIPLSTAAMDAIDSGEEAFKIEKLSNLLDVDCKNIIELSSEDIINWLVSQEFIIPLGNERICFFHQSVTEYLAATKLAKLFLENPDILKEKLSFRRWDQALFLTLSLLNKEDAGNFLETIIQIDFELALSSVKYMESDTSEIVERLLSEMTKRASIGFEKMSEIANALEDRVPLTEAHIPSLKKLISFGNSLGGVAVSKLLDILEYDYKEEALDLIQANCDDYNFCTQIGRSLKKIISIDDLPKLLSLTNQVQDKVNSKKIKKYHGFDSALGDMMKHFEPSLVFRTFFKPKLSKIKQKVHIDVLSDFLRNCRSNEGLKISVDLLLAGINEAATEIYFITQFAKPEDNLDFSVFRIEHILSLLSIAKNKKNKEAEWALSSIGVICSNRVDFIPTILETSKQYSGVLKAALLYSASLNDDYTLVFEALQELCEMDSEKLSLEPFSLISHMDDINWQGQELLFVRLMKLRNIHLAYNLCDPIALSRDFSQSLIFDIGPIEWWLDWFSEFLASKSKEWMFIDRVPHVIGRCISKEKRQEFIKEFNNPNSHYRRVLNDIIITNLEDLNFEELSENTITFLLDELKTKKLSFLKRTVLTDIANETFVIERLIPLVEHAKGIELGNLNNLIESIGKKNKRRYLLN